MHGIDDGYGACDACQGLVRYLVHRPQRETAVSQRVFVVLHRVQALLVIMARLSMFLVVD